MIRTKYSMGSGIVLISEASEAILGTYFATCCFSDLGEGGKGVYVARTLNCLLLKRISVGKVEVAHHLCPIETANLLGQVPASEDLHHQGAHISIYI